MILGQGLNVHEGLSLVDRLNRWVQILRIGIHPMELESIWWSLPAELFLKDGVVQRASWQVGGLGNGSYGDAKVGVVHEHNGVGPNGGVGASWLLSGKWEGLFW